MEMKPALSPRGCFAIDELSGRFLFVLGVAFDNLHFTSTGSVQALWAGTQYANLFNKITERPLSLSKGRSVFLFKLRISDIYFIP
ncbi:MAG: hypothetical protein PWQ55_1396 [Chloroflexota bacterium]|nr:hypothetical protein [Chloroflexota bacterium]